LLVPLEKVSKFPGRFVKNAGNIREMTSETGVFSVVGTSVGKSFRVHAATTGKALLVTVESLMASAG